MSNSRLLIVLLLASVIIPLSSLPVESQPVTLAVFPKQNSIGVPADVVLSATFGEGVTNINSNTFPVYGSLTGRYTGTYLGSGTNKIRFIPSQPFKPGEKIQAELTQEIRAVGVGGPGLQLQNEVVWEFHIQAAETTADFSPSFGLASGNQLIEPIVGDMDGDTDLDIVAPYMEKPFLLFVNNGTPQPWEDVTGVPFLIPENQVSGVMAAAIDPDVDIDLVVESPVSIPRQLYFNIWPFTPWPDQPVGPSHQSSSMAYGDLDSDGDLDIVTGNSSASTEILYNNGTSNPFAGVTPVILKDSVNDRMPILVGDANTDGSQDIISGRKLYRNPEYPISFATSTPVTLTNEDHTCAALGDLNGDGFLDLVFSPTLTSPATLLLNNGTRNPWLSISAILIGSVTGTVNRLSIADMNGDSHLDLIMPRRNSTDLLFLNNGTGNPFEGVVPKIIENTPFDTLALIPGDLDGDLDLDLVGAHSGVTPGIRVYINSGYSPMVTPTPTETRTATISPTSTSSPTPLSTNTPYPTYTPYPTFTPPVPGDATGDGKVNALDLLELLRHWDPEK